MSFPLPPRPRRSLEDFGLGRELGDGSLATVRLATEHASGRRYALKMFCRQHLRSNHKDRTGTSPWRSTASAV
ncbi:unnamed protein product [Prorocentrum cordatum]|uniref:Non-specific serine/threonine protein kinase n=1 Tax=Prorocentrum cordatum TaxID=2364126 RepID=A0ABN9PJ12_9DINO|nr:unnamed protein product [Polarella glacialis]